MQPMPTAKAVDSAVVRPHGVPASQAAGANAVLEHTIPSPLGPLRLGATGDGLCLLDFQDPLRIEAAHRGLNRWLGLPFVPGRNAHIDHAILELEEYFAGHRREFTVPLIAPGTPFEKQVWAALGTIPYGVTWSYADLARAIGNPDAQRAVGMANGRNRIALLIPCHRVVNTGGALGGYSGGLGRKRWLLELERRPR
jgi:AraC family transcriptional regulator of adaptative response/methylated-DNA-[protein]-cysteine methyltransferase